ncbi:hypothetical protein RIF29_18422 [Crotalaria pallida]|uniref:Uncharacterized protein n=1 Tax=Crotalaria pallida TaxID=3830 RepID=A0AAN9IKR8_CROPI
MTTDAEQGRTKSLVDLGHDLAVEILHRLPHRDTGQWTKNELSIPTGHYFEVYTIQDAITFDGKLILLGFMGFHSQKNIIISIDNDGGSSDANVIMFGSLDDFNAWSGCPHGPVLSVSQEHLRFAWLTKSTNVPILKIWELKQCQLSLVHEVDFTGIVSDDEWISTIYLKSTFMTMMEERMGSRRNAEDICAPIVLGFDPNDENRVYLNLIYCDRMAKYDIRRRTLNLVPDTCVASFTKSKENVFQVVLPLWPTMVPHLVTPDSSTEHS